MSDVRYISPGSMPKPRGYTHIVEVHGPGRTIYLAGQLGLDINGQFPAPGDFRAQVVQAFENVKVALAEVGADFNNVVKVTNYFTDINDLPTYFEVRDRYVNTQAPPASTAVEITRLALEGAVYELEAVAVLPPK